MRCGLSEALDVFLFLLFIIIVIIIIQEVRTIILSLVGTFAMPSPLARYFKC